MSITFTALVAIVMITIVQAGGDPLALAQLGTKYSLADQNGTEGYDGQFVYYIAMNPFPSDVKPLLDVPAYRYQRILLPLIVRFLSFGDDRLVPWLLAFVGVISQVVGTWAIVLLLNRWSINSWYALVYGLWAGFTLSVRLDLPETLAYALVCWAILEMERERIISSSILFGLALFAKEVTIIYVFGGVIYFLIKRLRRQLSILLLFSIIPFIIFQGWIWRIFGEIGIGSGGAMATSFEIIPYMGLFRIGFFSPVYLIMMALAFVPSIVIPSVWGIYTSVNRWLMGDRGYLLLALFLNALVIAFLPFSTFRETGGLLRFSCGLVLAVLLYASRYRIFRVLNYSYFWLFMNAFLFK